jgi:acetyltransferase-like isoleucine patch superfamily enzyme
MSLHQWIRRRDSPLQRAAYTAAKKALATDFPTIPMVHALLAGERQFRKNALRHLIAKIYYAPLLRRQARACGKGLVLYEDIPKIFGNLGIYLGNRVTLSGRQVWFACGDETEKRLMVGDDTYIGFAAELFCGTTIEIGRHVLIANHVLINGYDGHPVDPVERAAGQRPGPGGFGAIRIGDYAWVGSKAIILKNVSIGRGAIVASGAVVTRDVSELTVVAGNPAQVVRTLDTPTGWVTEARKAETAELR